MTGRTRTLVYFVAVSLDGFIAGPDGDFSMFPVEGDHIDMLVRDYPDTLPGTALDALGVTAHNDVFDTVVMGWNTYAVGLPHGRASPYPHLRQYVFSRTHAKHDGHADVQVTADDPVALARQLKADDSSAHIWLCGGGRLASTLLPEIDRLVLKVNPVLIGNGIKLFEHGTSEPPRWTLHASVAYGSGVVVNDYARSGHAP
jgi:dihydrofolate reductase